ncbi:hypothetical protein JCM5353_004852 [Sporobolomyces roseus]
MPSPPPSYTAVPPSPQSTRPARTPSTPTVHTLYGSIRLERGENDKEQSSASSFLAGRITALFAIIGILVIVLATTRAPRKCDKCPSPRPPCPAPPEPSPPTISSLATVAKVTATESWMIWNVYYEACDSSTSSRPLSQSLLYVESWAEAPSEEIKIDVTSPCEIYAIDLHAGPECKGDGEERDCQTMWSSLQVYSNLTDCREEKRTHNGLYKFGIGLSKFGSSYALEKEGIHSGTDLVPREEGFDWSWSAERARKEQGTM